MNQPVEEEHSPLRLGIKSKSGEVVMPKMIVNDF